MNEFVVQFLIFVLSATFLSLGILIRVMRKNMEEMSSRSTVTMMRVRDMMTGKIRKFKR
jgi:hypothetical protein